MVLPTQTGKEGAGPRNASEWGGVDPPPPRRPVLTHARYSAGTGREDSTGGGANQNHLLVLGAGDPAYAQGVTESALFTQSCCNEPPHALPQ